MLRTIAPRRRPTIAELLDDQLSEFDALLRDVRCGISSPAQYHALEARAHAIGQGMRDAFRRGGAGRG
ncbi:MAG TPA: hypothetical protein PKD99_02360 [Sphingopyxis sp.]|nr:hypothetical protein [Sphingopyxis sp.]HMP43920.1 hypothetical protein [Sphingopyxis sp.]HMQ18087.1 hypothetical protein [Sphingopyxis sp.]